MSWSDAAMARVVADMLQPGSTANLGIGLPSLVAQALDPSRGVMVHSENGVLGVAGRPTPDAVSPTLINAGKETISIGAGASFFDSALSFGMIRGGHIDTCVLGAFQVDAAGSLANWSIPGKKVTGMGGAMDLVSGARQVVVMMRHRAKAGAPKLVPKCTLPLTGFEVVDYVVTELGTFKPLGPGFGVAQLAPGVSIADLGLEAHLLAEPG